MAGRLKYALSMASLLLSAPTLLAQSKESAPPRRLVSWTSDRREYQVGDVITVLVSEATLATATKSQTGSDQQSRANDFGITPPKMGAGGATGGISADMSMDKTASSKQTGDAKRGVNFKGDISVRVIAVDKTGLLQIKGSKVVDVDKNKQSLNFSGWVRPEDISPQNYVGSERVADAALTYSLTGDIGKTRGGLIGRILNVFWP